MIFVYFEEKKKHCEINTGRHRWTYICNTPPPPKKNLYNKMVGRP
jgi:hypothetical protein